MQQSQADSNLDTKTAVSVGADTKGAGEGPSEPFASEQVILSPPISMTGAVVRLKRLSKKTTALAKKSPKWLWLIITILAWIPLLVLWVVWPLFGFVWSIIMWIFAWPVRVFGRYRRHSKVNKLRHREMMEAVSKNS